MEQQQIPETNFQKFLKTKPAMILGLLITLGLAILVLAYLNVINQSCCSLGYLLLACVGLYVPKFFGVTKTQYLAMFGVVLFIVLTVAGAFVYSKPIYEGRSDYRSFDSEGFSNVNFEYAGDSLTVTVDYTGTGTVTAHLFKVELGLGDSQEFKATMTGSGSYTCTFANIPRDFVYQYYFDSTDGETVTKSTSGYYLDIIDDSQLTKYFYVHSLVNCFIIIVIFYLMLFLTAIMRKNLEKTRARMEAEGRLYPQGYGRCKECGSIVLPGETCCRKCGAYIEVPDELRHKKVDMVECSECGAEIPEDAKVCPKCGAVFDEEEEIVYVDSEEKKE